MAESDDQDFAVKHIASHLEGATDFIPLHHRTKTGRYAMFQGLAALFQKLEDEVYNAYIGTSLAHAKGTALDFQGFVAGVPRGGLEDYWYRYLIRAGFAAKTCTGSTNEIIRMFKIAMAEPLYVEFTRYNKNLIILTSWRDEFLPAEYVQRAADIVKKACPIGSVAIFETTIPYVGGTGAPTDASGTPLDAVRTYAPLPATDLQAPCARVW